MRMGTLNKKSTLISKLGYEGTTMRVEYTDGAVYDYFKVPLSTFRCIVRAISPGESWLKLRSQYKYSEVKT